MVYADFEEFLIDVKAQSGICRVVVRASQGMPKAAHRIELQRWYREHSVRGSIMTDSPIVRGGVAAPAWFGATVRAFPLQDVEPALDFVKIEHELRPECRQRLQTLTNRVDRHALASD